jgi:hypothetical protein
MVIDHSGSLNTLCASGVITLTGASVALFLLVRTRRNGVYSLAPLHLSFTLSIANPIRAPDYLTDLSR